jgi:antitoxin ParD1/3/4
MADHETRTIKLPTEQAGYIDALVANGSYTSASEVVRAGLRALQERDASLECWLRDDVAPVHDAMQADPARGIRTDEVFNAVRDRHAKRLKSRRDA